MPTAKPDPTPLPNWVVPDEVQEWLHTVSLLEVVVWAGGIVAGLWLARWIVRKGWPKLLVVARGVLRVNKIFDVVMALPERIEQIHHETHHNNGSSLKDAAIRTEKAVQDLTEQMEAVIERLDRIDPQNDSQEGN